MSSRPSGSSSELGERTVSEADKAQLAAGLQLLGEPPRFGRRLWSRIRNAFLTGLVIVGPVTITLYMMWVAVHWIDAWVKPLLPERFNPETYLPFPLPGIGVITAIIGVTLIGALAANLLGRTLISSGDMMLSSTPIVRNVYGALKQIFEGVIPTGGPTQSFQKVGMIEFPSKGLWSLVFVTGDTTGEIKDVQPGGETDLLTVFMPTGIVPPAGFICFVPRASVILLNMTAEEAAKVILSGGIVVPDMEARLKKLGAKPVAS